MALNFSSVQYTNYLHFRGVHSIARRLRTNPPPPPPRKIDLLFFSLFAFSHRGLFSYKWIQSREKSTCVFFLFLLSPTEACFLTNETKANEFDRRSFATLKLKWRSWSCRRTATAADGLGGSGSGHRYCDRDRQRVWTWFTRHSGSRRRSDVVQCRD